MMSATQTRFRAMVVLIALGVAVPTASVLAAVREAPAASRYYPFVGHWKGHGRLSEPGRSPVPLALSLNCDKVSSGWAIRCEMAATHDKMRITESDLMGVDPVTGTGHWYAVTNQGETHDHITEWPDPGTMHAHYDWIQDGKKMAEKISFVFAAPKSVEFRSTVSQDGKEVGEFSGTMTR